MFKAGEIQNFLSGIVTTGKPAQDLVETPEQIREWKRNQEEEARRDRGGRKVVPMKPPEPVFNPTKAEAEIVSYANRIRDLKQSLSERQQRHEESIAQIEEAHHNSQLNDRMELDDAINSHRRLKHEMLLWAQKLGLFDEIKVIEETFTPPAIPNEFDEIEPTQPAKIESANDV